PAPRAAGGASHSARPPPDRCPLRAPCLPSGRSIRFFAVPVVKRFDATDDADASPHHLARARVPADVVRLSCAPGEKREAVVTAAKAMRDPRAGWHRDDGTATHGMLLVRPDLERSRSVEHDEDLLLGGVGVRRARRHTGSALEVRHAGPARPCSVGEEAAPAATELFRLDVGDIYDRRRPLRLRLGPDELRLAVPRVS